MVLHRATDFQRHAVNINNCPKWEHVMKVDLSQSVRQIWLWGSSAVQHPELFDVMLGQKCEAPKQIELIIGPPGTGKTRGISERTLDNLYDGSSFVGLRCAWTNVAARDCLLP